MARVLGSWWYFSNILRKKYYKHFCVLLWCKTFRYFTGVQSCFLLLVLNRILNHISATSFILKERPNFKTPNLIYTFEESVQSKISSYSKSVFLTHVGIRQMLTWFLPWKAKSLYHVGTFSDVIFSATSQVQNYQNETGEKYLQPSKYVLTTYFKEF